MPSERMEKSQEEVCAQELANIVTCNMLIENPLALPSIQNCSRSFTQDERAGKAQSVLAFLRLPVVLLEQIHGITIHTVDSYSCYPAMALRSVEGDGLITTLSNTAVGMLTADCLPVILYNSDTNALAILHAGWRGMTQGIVRQAIEKMGLHRGNCSVVLGPCARACCYEVQEDFLSHVPEAHRSSIERREGKLYFDLPAYARHELALYNLSASIVHTESACTICDTNFYSYRREGASCTQRQATIAVLHN